MNTTQLRDAAEIALAAYGQFGQPGPILRNDDLMTLNGDAAGFADRQASLFRSRFTVAIPTFSDATSGSGSSSFDATVFVGIDSSVAARNNNQVFVSLRGTQQKTGTPNDLTASADTVSLGTVLGQVLPFSSLTQRARPNPVPACEVPPCAV